MLKTLYCKSNVKSSKISSTSLTIDHKCTSFSAGCPVLLTSRFSNEYLPIHTRFTADIIHLHKCTFTQWWELTATMPTAPAAPAACLSLQDTPVLRFKPNLQSVLSRTAMQERNVLLPTAATVETKTGSSENTWDTCGEPIWLDTTCPKCLHAIQSTQIYFYLGNSHQMKGVSAKEN